MQHGPGGGNPERLTAQLLKQGDAARDARNWVQAATFYRQALDRQPALTPIWVQLGHALKEAGDHAGAEAAYREALALDAGAADTHLQLGHLMKLGRRRAEAIDAYAAALRLDPDLVAAREALLAVLGYSPSEFRKVVATGAASKAPLGAGAAREGPIAGRHRPATPADRYGALFAEANRKAGAGHDIIWLGVIDWHYRIQRPQHLAANLADMGARIFYLSLAFEEADDRGRFRILAMPHPGLFEIRMRVSGDPFESVHRGLSDGAVGDLQLALDELVDTLGIRAPIIVAEHPGWHRVARGIAGATIVFDCLDLATGFTDAPPSLAVAEAAMIAEADVIVAASAPLAERFEPQRTAVIIRNAADVDFFAAGAGDRTAGDNPVIGYFGAIADWFNIAWIEACAAAHPNWRFQLIGRAAGCDTSRAARLPNVRFYDEQPYRELPRLLREFDVAVIPFKLNELTRCTNPVKLYEYLAAGKPVVAARMPEVEAATDLVYIADDAASFASCIGQALAEDSPTLRARRQEWAREHSWLGRARRLLQAIDASFPLVSVVVSGHGNWEETNACLFALQQWSDYPNLEIILVDGAAVDDGRFDRLRQRDPRLQVVVSDKNEEFVVGWQLGLRAASGKFVILLDAGMCVTGGWVRDLIRPMQLNAQIGLAGPLTDGGEGEQNARIPCRSIPEMRLWARQFVRGRPRRTAEVRTLTFSCVAMRRDVLEAIGLPQEASCGGLDAAEAYCRRVREAGYTLAIAQDVFVHRRGEGEAQAERAADAEPLSGEPMAHGGEGEWLPRMLVGPAGRRTGGGIAARPGEAGHLVYGPYARLGAGSYRVRLRWIAGPPPAHLRRDQPAATIEAVCGDGTAYLAQRQLYPRECARPEHDLLFGLAKGPPQASPIEVRVWTSGALSLTIQSITVERMSAPPKE